MQRTDKLHRASSKYTLNICEYICYIDSIGITYTIYLMIPLRAYSGAPDLEFVNLKKNTHQGLIYMNSLCAKTHTICIGIGLQFSIRARGMLCIRQRMYLYIFCVFLCRDNIANNRDRDMSFAHSHVFAFSAA